MLHKDHCRSSSQRAFITLFGIRTSAARRPTPSAMGVLLALACFIATCPLGDSAVAQAPAVNAITAEEERARQLHEAGRFGEAISHGERLLALTKDQFGDTDVKHAAAQMLLAELYREVGRFAEAEPLLRGALAIRELKLPPRDADTGRSYDALGRLYRERGRFSEALQHLEHARDILQKALDPNHLDLARTLHHLGTIFSVLRRYAEAESMHKSALRIAEKSLGKEAPLMGDILDGLGTVYQGTRRYGPAESMRKRALEMARRTFGSKHPMVGSRLANLAGLYLEQNRLAEAEPLFTRALAVWQESYGPKHPAVGLGFNNLAAFHFARRNWASSLAYTRRARAIVQERWRANAGPIGAGLQDVAWTEFLRNRHVFSWTILTAWELAQQQPEKQDALRQEAFSAAQWDARGGAGVALSQMAARYSKGDGELATLARERQDRVRDWLKDEAELSAGLVAPPERRNSENQRRLERRLATNRHRISEIDHRFMRDFKDYYALANPSALSLRTVQRLLGADEALVQFAFAGEHGFAWVVTDQEIRWERLPSAAKIVPAKVSALRCGLDEQEWIGESTARRCVELLGLPAEQPDASKLPPFHLGVAHELYQILFSTFESTIRGKRLLVVPSGPLTSLPFPLTRSGSPSPLTSVKYTLSLVRLREKSLMPAAGPT